MLKLFMHLNRPGGELEAGEDELDGLKRLMTEVNIYPRYFYISQSDKIGFSLDLCNLLNLMLI